MLPHMPSSVCSIPKNTRSLPSADVFGALSGPPVLPVAFPSRVAQLPSCISTMPFCPRGRWLRGTPLTVDCDVARLSVQNRLVSKVVQRERLQSCNSRALTFKSATSRYMLSLHFRFQSKIGHRPFSSRGSADFNGGHRGQALHILSGHGVFNDGIFDPSLCALMARTRVDGTKHLLI